MGHHFTRNTITATAYCKKCRKNTNHRVTDRRLDACLECIAKLEAHHAARTTNPQPQPQQQPLFPAPPKRTP
jgi:hypothetical protein